MKKQYIFILLVIFTIFLVFVINKYYLSDNKKINIQESNSSWYILDTKNSKFEIDLGWWSR